MDYLILVFSIFIILVILKKEEKNEEIRINADYGDIYYE